MLKEKNALISGSSRGIGKAIAIKLAENNAFVGINYLKNEKEANQTLKTIKEKGGKGLLLKGDISKIEDIERIIDVFIKKTGKIDILINNAGIYNRTNFKELTIKKWDETLSTNLTGCFNLCKKSIPYMENGGKIIFISSQLALKGSLHGADYVSSKAGILGLMKSLALELADKKINVNAITPGTIDTDLLKNYSENARIQRINEIPLKRLGTPEDIANACLFFASDLSSYITGETLNVNGGLYIQ